MDVIIQYALSFFLLQNSYADVCVHRLLAASIGVEPLPTLLHSKTYLQKLAANMNKRHHASKIADRLSTKLHSLIVLLDGQNKPKVEDAYVLDGK